MLLNPLEENKHENSFLLGSNVYATTNKVLCAPIFAEFWNNFCYQAGNLHVEECNELIFTIGKIQTLPQPKNGYLLSITPDGVSISACDSQNLIYGFFALLERITPVRLDTAPTFSLSCCHVRDEGAITTRMAHLCIFPETKLSFVQKFIRICAYFRYTHLIVEFWGTLKFDCLKELGWKNAYSKEEIRPLFHEANTLGLQIVPMFNHWGHASASRLGHGKHVLLDQNPRLALLFDQTGWIWKISSSEVQALQKNIRKELIELCGESDYFHLGCDEAHGANDEKDFLEVITYLNEISNELKQQGRKAIIWGDMFLSNDAIKKQTKNVYECNNTLSIDKQNLLLDTLSKEIIIADWQYNAQEAPVESALFFQQHNFETLLCPWDRTYENGLACAKTVKEYRLNGILHTTWHTLSSGIQTLATTAASAWGEQNSFSPSLFAQFASIVRKLCPANGDYAYAGWAEKQIADYY